jgi:hypothetical protein
MKEMHLKLRIAGVWFEICTWDLLNKKQENNPLIRYVR